MKQVQRSISYSLLFLLMLSILSAGAWATQIKDSESATHGVDASKYYIVDTYEFPGFKLIQLELPVLSIYSYMLISDGEALVVEGHDLDEVLEIASDAGLRVVGLELYLCELVSLEEEVDDLGLVAGAGSHVMLPSACHDDLSVVAEGTGIPADGSGTDGQEHGEVLVGEERALIDRFSGHAEDAMSSEPCEAVLDEDGKVDLGIEERQSHGDAGRESDVLTGRLCRGDGLVADLSGSERDVGVLAEVRGDLREVGLSDERGEIEVPSDGMYDGLTGGLVPQPVSAVGAGGLVAPCSLRLHGSPPVGTGGDQPGSVIGRWLNSLKLRRLISLSISPVPPGVK